MMLDVNLYITDPDAFFELFALQFPPSTELMQELVFPDNRDNTGIKS